MTTTRLKLILAICVLPVLCGCGKAGTPQPGPTPTAALPARSETEPAPTDTVTPVPRSVPLVVFAAGSLIIPFDALETAFERRYPSIDVRAEYHGSIQVIRHATELHEQIDVVATADASLIPMLMYAVNDPDTGKPYANWYIRFASNRLALAYTPQSKRAAEITAENWYTILSDRSVQVGLADPRFDASGYRALMAFALAQDHYHQPTVFREMFNGRLVVPIAIFQDDDLTTITVPEIVDTKPGTGLIVRGASIQLIALLQSGDLDYAFEYESVIRQHGLEMVSLPDAINLGTEGLEQTYGKVLVNMDFRRFASVKPQFRGERIGYGITIPAHAQHPEEAAAFIAFLLGPEGRAVMAANQHPLSDPATGNHYDRIPPRLQALCVPGEEP